MSHPHIQKNIVSTPQGQFQGVQLSDNVNVFLGIPYAEPPVGKLRFRPPQKINPGPYDWQRITNATSFGPICFQFHYRTVFGANLLPATNESEDCLTLNVFVPRLKPTGKRPVYIWSYGGAFGEGGGSVPLYNPQNFVENHQDIIVVTLK
jgi:carboxylesterase type B